MSNTGQDTLQKFIFENAAVRGELIDIPGNSIRVDGLPQAPTGMKIAHIDLVVRLVKA